MSIQYHEVFRLECLHGYFSNGQCAALTMRPTHECSALLNRYDCLFRPLSGGGAVYHGATGGRSLLRLFDEEAPFAFALSASDPLFQTFTESDGVRAAVPGESIQYFNNTQEHVGKTAGAEWLLLHPEGNGFAQAPLPIRPGRFDHAFARPLTESAVQVFDALGHVVFGGKTPTHKTSTMQMDLISLRTGRYSLHIDKEDPFDFYLNNGPALRDWGVVEIFAGGPATADSVPVRYRPIDARGNVGSPLSFAISLEARRSFWRYFIVSQAADRTYDDYVVAGAMPGSVAAVAFTGPVRQMVNGRNAWVFESKAALPVFEFPGNRHEFTLKAITGNGTAKGPLTLPYAQPGTTRLERESDGTGFRMCSEIYVYL